MSYYYSDPDLEGDDDPAEEVHIFSLYLFLIHSTKLKTLNRSLSSLTKDLKIDQFYHTLDLTIPCYM